METLICFAQKIFGDMCTRARGVVVLAHVYTTTLLTGHYDVAENSAIQSAIRYVRIFRDGKQEIGG